MRPRVLFCRSPFLFWLSIAALCELHVLLCRFAATHRGGLLDPSDLIACFVAPLLAGVPALFDERRRTRTIGVVVLSLGLGYVYGVVRFNLSCARPHPGAHLGFVGLIADAWGRILFDSFIPSLLVFGSLHFYERVTGDLWSLVRQFRDDSGNSSERWRFGLSRLLALTAAIAFICLPIRPILESGLALTLIVPWIACSLGAIIAAHRKSPLMSGVLGGGFGVLLFPAMPSLFQSSPIPMAEDIRMAGEIVGFGALGGGILAGILSMGRDQRPMPRP